MEIILQNEILSLGKIGDIVNVAPGYANNYLIPKGMAIIASKGNLRQLEAKRSSIDKKEAAAKKDAEKLAAKIDGKELKIEVRAGEEGRLYGSVTAKDIAVAIGEQLSVEVSKNQVRLSEVIKDAGIHEITVKFHFDVDAVIKTEIVAIEEKSQ